MSEQTPSNLPVLYRAAEVARLLKVSRSLAYRMIQEGTIPSVRFRHSVRVRCCDLEEFIQKSWSGWADGSGPGEEA